jgi:hypothetical protein
MRSTTKHKRRTTVAYSSLVYETTVWNHLTRTLSHFTERLQQSRGIVRWLAAGLSLRRPGFTTESVDAGFVVDKVALGQGLFNEYFGLPLSIRFHRVSPYSNGR